MNRRRMVGGCCLVVVLGLAVAACNVEPVTLRADQPVQIGAGGDSTLALATLTDGTVVAVGESFFDSTSIEVYQQRYSSTGDPLSSNPTMVNAVVGYRQVNPTVVALPGDTYAVLWLGDYPAESTDSAILGRLFDSGGNPLTGDVLLADNASGSTVGTVAAAAVPGVGLVAAWADRDDTIHAQEFSTTLGPVGPSVSVDDSQMDASSQPAVAGLQDHGFAVTWNVRAGTALRVFNGFDVPIGPPVVVGGMGPEPPVATGLGDGSFVIVGEDLGPGESYGHNDVEALHFDEYGNQLGDVVPMSSPGSPLVYNPVVAPLPNGGYVAGWLESTDYSHYTLMVHRLFANGVEISPEIQTSQVGALGTAGVTGLPGDGFAIWLDSLQFYLPAPN
ncbi:MAG TPA: hypothetical protein VHU17_08285 [Acidimicrobiales bacterium]|jgi:hypothetical protein|nr:hypothetical protein [Acidimicrobiales bacterium]